MRFMLVMCTVVMASCASATENAAVAPDAPDAISSLVDAAALHQALLQLSGPRAGATMLRVRFDESGKPSKVDSPYQGFPEGFTSQLEETLLAHLRPQPPTGEPKGMIVFVQGGSMPKFRLIDLSESRAAARLTNKSELAKLARAVTRSYSSTHSDWAGQVKAVMVTGVITLDGQIIEPKIQRSSGSRELDQEAIQIAGRARALPPKIGRDYIQAPTAFPVEFHF